MVFNNLDLGLQTVLLENFYAKGKAYILFIIIAFSLIYLFYWKPFREEETPSWVIGTLRLIMTMYSKVFLVFSMFFVLFLTPEAEFWGFLGTVINMLLIPFLFTLAGLSVEIWYFGIHYMMSKMGMKTNDPRIKLFLSKLNKRGRFE